MRARNNSMEYFLNALRRAQEDTEQAAQSLVDRVRIVERWIAEDKQWFGPQQLDLWRDALKAEQKNDRR